MNHKVITNDYTGTGAIRVKLADGTEAGMSSVAAQRRASALTSTMTQYLAMDETLANEVRRTVTGTSLFDYRGYAIDQQSDTFVVDRITDPAGVMYPSHDLLCAARERGIPLVLSSDAHEAEHVGRLWDEGVAKASEAGYRSSLRLSDRMLVPLPGQN